MRRKMRNKILKKSLIVLGIKTPGYLFMKNLQKHLSFNHKIPFIYMFIVL